jgi:predicted house-cleaning noncanonical NTP pyrophosphatase (MazG superfamily)
MSRTFYLGKQVRNGIVPYMESQGQTPVYRKLTSEQEVPAIIEKVIEEAKEGDLIDTVAAVRRWIELSGMAPGELERAIQEKEAKSGSFNEGIFVETVTVPDGDSWGDYYAAEPNRFPEVQNG